MVPRATLLILACLLATQVVSGQRLPRTERTGWYFVLREDGVVVHAKDRKDRGLPTFRGKGEVAAGLFEIGAVLADARRHTEWIVKCSQAGMLRYTGPFDMVFYNRTKAPWPVSDRDVVVKVKTTYQPELGLMLSKFEDTSHPKRPLLKGVVRMPDLKGSYRMQAITRHRTLVTLTVDADPGGMLPQWLSKIVTRVYPRDVIRNLRKQLKKTEGSYDTKVAEWVTRYGDYKVPGQKLEPRADRR